MLIVKAFIIMFSLLVSNRELTTNDLYLADIQDLQSLHMSSHDSDWMCLTSWCGWVALMSPEADGWSLPAVESVEPFSKASSIEREHMDSVW